jgi:hypothetical protein
MEKSQAFKVLIDREILSRNRGSVGVLNDEDLVRCVSSCKSLWSSNGGPGLKRSIRNVSDSGIWTFNRAIMALAHTDPTRLETAILTALASDTPVDTRCYRYLSVSTIACLLKDGRVDAVDLDLETLVCATHVSHDADDDDDEMNSRGGDLVYILQTLHEKGMQWDLERLVSTFGMEFASQHVACPWVNTPKDGTRFIEAVLKTGGVDKMADFFTAYPLANSLQNACMAGMTCDDIYDATGRDERATNALVRFAGNFMQAHAPRLVVGALTSGIKRSLIVSERWASRSVEQCCDVFGLLPYHAIHCYTSCVMPPPDVKWWRNHGRECMESPLYRDDVVWALEDTFEKGLAVDLLFDMFGRHAPTIVSLVHANQAKFELQLTRARNMSLEQTWSMVSGFCKSECDAAALMVMICEMCVDMRYTYPLRDVLQTLNRSKCLRDVRDALAAFWLVIPSERKYITFTDVCVICKHRRRRSLVVAFIIRTVGGVRGRAGVDSIKRRVGDDHCVFIDRALNDVNRARV